MTVYIFTGPTLGPSEASQILDAIYLPPAAQGDVYRAARRRPRAIGIVDGYFDSVPSVWHKEILWAMREGIHVFGSASMGALRAAELAAFGMEGVGEIFEAYRRGELTDDDEVAIVHDSAANCYRALSIAMVNIRATLATAEHQGVIGPSSRAALIRIAKELFYPERTYPRLLADAAAQGLAGAELDRLRAWLPGGQVDQKRADALAMLHAIDARLATSGEPKRVRYHFEHTIYWEYVVQTTEDAITGDEASEANTLMNALFDEARLDPAAYQLARRGALVGALAHTLADQQGLRVAPEQIRESIIAFRRARGLLEADSMTEWLQAHRLDAHRFAELIEEQALARAAIGWATSNITTRIVDQLRLDGAYARLWQRTRHKQHVLCEAGLASPGLAEAEITRQELLRWYYGSHGDGTVPPDLDQYAIEAGFRDEQAFIHAVLREFYYLKLTQTAQR
jgi:hypothetical protein